MTPIWCAALSGQPHRRNTVDLSESPLGGSQLGLLITITQLPSAGSVHCIHSRNIPNCNWFVICVISHCMTFTCCWPLQKNIQYTLQNVCANAGDVGKAASCVVPKCITSSTNSKLITAIVGLIVFSVCLKCGETEGWLSWGPWPIKPALLFPATINKEALAVCVCLHEKAQLVEREEKSNAEHLTLKLSEKIVVGPWFMHVISEIKCCVFCCSKGNKNLCFSKFKQSEWVTTATIPSLCSWNRSLYSCMGIYMLHGGINYKLQGQPSCVQSHSCPTEKLQQALELNNTAILCVPMRAITEQVCWV